MRIAIFVLILSFVALGCSPDGNGTVQPNDQFGTILTQGDWVISEYSFDGNDRLYLFGGYRVVFGTNATVTASKGNASALGTWSSGTSNGKSLLYFDFASTPSFSQLNGNWESTSLMSNQVKLQRTNNSGGTIKDILVVDQF